MVGKSLHARIARLITLSIRKKDRLVQINLSPSDRLRFTRSDTLVKKKFNEGVKASR